MPNIPIISLLCNILMTYLELGGMNIPYLNGVEMYSFLPEKGDTIYPYSPEVMP